MNRAGFIILLIIGLTLSACSGGGEQGEVSRKQGTDKDKENISAEISGVAEISFEHKEHDFGKIAEGEKVGCIFKYTNTGYGNLIIRKATGSCGCTVPRWDREPTPPGETGQMEVIFDSSGRRGKQNKSITVTTNGSNKVVILTIKADIAGRESEEVNLN